MEAGEEAGILGAIIGTTILSLVCYKCAKTFTNQSDLDEHNRNGC